MPSHGGWVFLGQLWRQLQLPPSLSQAIQLKQRRRGASDAEMLLSLLATQVAVSGALLDVDALRADTVGRRLLGLSEVPDSRRLGEYLTRFGRTEVATLEALVQSVAREAAPQIIEHEVAQRGYLPLFVDGSAIEVEGRLFAQAGKGYNGQNQYWWHGVFLSGLWAAGHLHPGVASVTQSWQDQLDGIADWIAPDIPVWVHVDNAYYS